ncbi:MAG TPA: metalloregulator ArsR/SmtB family transcription factor [Xanthomonadaceae bacterium]|nr:metalloregulator ArsR/SmtB family transcription factor [Xanthomonadaceae bacterium]
MESPDALAVLAALAQESRLAVYRELVAREPDGAHPHELAEAFGLAPATLSFHLKALQHAGLVHARRSGRNLLYRADIEASRRLVDFLTRHCCGGDPARCLPQAPARGARRAARG